MERLNQSDSIEDINSPAGRRHLQLQTQLEQLQEETFRCGPARMTDFFVILSCKKWLLNWLILISKVIIVAKSFLGWRQQKMTIGSVVKSLRKNSWMWSHRMKSSRHWLMKPSLLRMRWMSSGKMGLHLQLSTYWLSELSKLNYTQTREAILIKMILTLFTKYFRK